MSRVRSCIVLALSPLVAWASTAASFPNGPMSASSETRPSPASPTPPYSEEAPVTRPIDPDLFVASGTELRPFVCEATLPVPVSEAFRAWTDSEVWPRVYGAGRDELRAEIDLAIGGRYEWLFDGELGSNGCQVLSYVPDRMLSFSWNAPPTQPESRDLHTWVVVEFEPAEESSTRVRLTHLGFGEGANWDETRAYFQEAWPFVLAQFEKGLAAPDGAR